MVLVSSTAILLSNCSANQPDETSAGQSIKVAFYPAFNYMSELEFSDKDSLTITAYDSIETPYKRTVYIGQEELSGLLKGIESFNKEYKGPGEDGGGVDGIHVHIISNRLKANDTIRFSSPTRRNYDSVYYNILDPVFNIIRKNLTADVEAMYIEQLETHYFDYGVRIEKSIEIITRYMEPYQNTITSPKQSSHL